MKREDELLRERLGWEFGVLGEGVDMMMNLTYIC